MSLFFSSLLFYSLIIHHSHGATFACNANASCGCSSVSTVSVTQRIVGGEQAPDRAWGWMISLQANGGHTCGASLLTAEFALTAAHCLSDFVSNPSALSILAGTNFLSRPATGTAQKRTVTSLFVHPQYNAVSEINDIALIRFSALDTGNQSTLSSICLPTAGSNDVIDNEDLIAIGWGLTSENAAFVSDSLRQVTVGVIPTSNAACVASNEEKDRIICAGVLAGGKDTCQGDSGGPLMKFQNNQWFIVGITSRGIGCARPNTAGIYTKVTSFSGFINGVLSGQISPTVTVLTTQSSSSSTVSTSTQQTGNAGVKTFSVESSFFLVGALLLKFFY